MNFDDRWRTLAANARTQSGVASLAYDLASRARRRPIEGPPLVSARCAWTLAAAAAVLTAICLPVVLSEQTAENTPNFASLPPIPAAPSLPPPPALEAPTFYVALARATWKDINL